MNLILTKECAKRCSFCFTGDYSKNTEMSLDLIDQIISQYNILPYNHEKTHFNLLGGEPTQHSQFSEILEIFKKTGTSYTLISNLLFPEKIKQTIIKNNIKFLLCNGMELDKKNRIQLFSKNWKELKESRVLITLALTLSKESTIEYFKNYVNFLLENLDSIPWLRIGLDLNGSYIINNTYLGDIILNIQKQLPTTSITFDCQIPPCIFSYDENTPLYNYNNLRNTCDSVPVDVFYNNSAIYCYQAQHIKVDNIFMYPSYAKLTTHLRFKYKEIEQYKPIFKECKACTYYLWNQCNSLCLGCSKDTIQSIDIKNIT